MSGEIPGDALFVNPGGVFSAGNPGFLITATASGSAHTLHTAVTGTDDVDLVTLWAWTVSGANQTMTLEVGGVTIGPFAVFRNAMPTLVFARLPMNNGITLKAFAGAASVVGVFVSTTRLIKQTV